MKKQKYEETFLVELTSTRCGVTHDGLRALLVELGDCARIKVTTECDDMVQFEGETGECPWCLLHQRKSGA